MVRVVRAVDQRHGSAARRRHDQLPCVLARVELPWRNACETCPISAGRGRTTAGSFRQRFPGGLRQDGFGATGCTSRSSSLELAPHADDLDRFRFVCVDEELVKHLYSYLCLIGTLWGPDNGAFVPHPKRGGGQEYKRTIAENGGQLPTFEWGRHMSTPRHTRLETVSGRDHIHSRTQKPARTRSIKRLKALVVIDPTEASKRVLCYLGQLAHCRRSIRVLTAYIASRVPAELLETGGAEIPDREEQLQSNLRRQQRAWMAGTDKKAWRILRAAQSQLHTAGVQKQRIHTCVSSPLDAREAADEVLC